MTTRLLIEGMMPYRALNRLKREGICLKDVKKRKKNQIVCVVDAKDVEKVFAIYPKVCYNGGGYTAYIVRIMPFYGLQRRWEFAKKRLGLWLGVVLFLLLTVASNEFIFRIDVVGEPSYEAAVTEILKKSGVEKFRRYDLENADLITAEILRLNEVSFCSVRKIGSTLVVEVHTSPFSDE